MRVPRLLCSATSPMVPIIDELTRLASSDAPVLLLGDTGTGKDRLARHLHAVGPRADQPFIAVNCGAIPAALIEAELFGQGRATFSSERRREGRVALAAGGTLFLDDVSELPAAVQIKLLRLLQEQVYEAVGDVDSVSADVRVVAATSTDLLAEVEAGRFRRDLYYRLAVCPVTVPPLHSRGDDVVVLFHALLTEAGDTRVVEPAVETALRAYRWPGNVRELQNVVERLRICAPGPQITLGDLPAAVRAPVVIAPHVLEVAPVLGFNLDALRSASGAFVPMPVVDEDRVERDGLFAEPVARPTLPVNLTELLRDLENDYIDAALEQTRGNRQAAAALLGLQRTTLVEKLKRRDAGGRVVGVEQRSVV